MMFSSIRLKLTVWYVAILSVFVLAFASVTYFALVRSADRDLNERLREMSRSFIVAANAEQEEGGPGHPGENAVLGTIREMRLRDYQFTVFDAEGRLIGNSGEFEPPFIAGTGTMFHDLYHHDRKFRVYQTQMWAGPQQFRLAVIHSLDEQIAMRDQLLRVFFVAVPVTLLFAGFGGYYLARKSLEPVVEMSRQANVIGASNLGDRLTVKNREDELGRLAWVFNELLSRLDAAFEQQRRFMADASHELRTPLAIVRGESEVALAQSDRSAPEYRDSLAVVQNESKRLSRIVEDLFTLARADAGQFRVDFRPVYLDEIVADAARSIGVLARVRNITVANRSAPEMPMSGDESLLRRMFLNLLDNAIKYGREGGQLSIDCVSTAENHYVTITDDGMGIPAEAQDRIFERFYRVDKVRGRNQETGTSGSGLGLAIAQWIAQVHHGDIVLVSSDPTGSVFQVKVAR